MSYCRFENTLADLRDCANKIEEWNIEDSDNLSASEKAALRGMMWLMEEMVLNEDKVEEMIKFEGE